MLFHSDFWLTALIDCMICGVFVNILFLAVLFAIAEIVHAGSGHNGTRPTVFWYREARAWWKEPHV